MTKTQQKKAEISAHWSRMYDELRAIIRAEFPVGAQVKWRIGKHWQAGTVVESARYDFSLDLHVRNNKTGCAVHKDAVEFEHA